MNDAEDINRAFLNPKDGAVFPIEDMAVGNPKFRDLGESGTS